MYRFRKISLISVAIIVSMLCTSCKMFATQNVIDNIIPDHNIRPYSVADLVPYSYKEVKNARALYGMELQDFFLKNTSTESIAKRVTKKEIDDFNTELMIRTHNYKIIKNRCNMYFDQDGTERDSITEARESEYKAYYDAKNAKSIGTIKKYNDGKADGMPLMSIRAKMDTATDSDASLFYDEIECDIFKPVVISENEYNKLKFGDKVTFELPIESEDVYNKETKKIECTYIATDSFTYKNDDGKNLYCYIAPSDGKNECRRLVDNGGNAIEIYSETKPLQFMKLCRVAEANNPSRLYIAMINDSLTEYAMGEIVERALCGGYLVYKYKDIVYANCVATNPKGYITAVIEYTNLKIDNEFTPPNDEE